MFYISSLLRPKVDTDSPYIVHPIKTDTFPGELNNTFQTNIMFSASKEGQRKICTHVVHNGYVINFYIVYEEKLFLKLFFSIIHEEYMQLWEVFFLILGFFIYLWRSKSDEICFKVNFTSATPTKSPTEVLIFLLYLHYK